MYNHIRQAKILKDGLSSISDTVHCLNTASQNACFNESVSEQKVAQLLHNTNLTQQRASMV